MANRFCKIGGSNLLDGATLGNAWETAIYTFTNVGASNTAIFSGTSGGVFDIARPSTACPIPSGSAGNPTIITDNADGTVTFNHPGTSNRFGFFNFTTGAAKSYISWIGTSRGSIVLDAEFQPNAGSMFYFHNPINQNGNFQVKNLDMRNCYHSTILGGQCPDVDIASCDIHDNEPESLNNQPQNHGVYASGPRLLVHDCTIYNVSGWGIHCYSSSSPNHPGRKFYGNTIYNNGYGAAGTSDDNGSGIVVAEGGAEIYNNVIFNNGGHGIDTWRNTTVTIYHNTVHSNGKWGINVGLTGTGTSCTGTLVKNNISIGNGDGDLLVANNAVNTTISWNRFGTAAITNSGVNTITSGNAYSQDIAAICTDPTHATLASRNYQLKAGSPAIGATTTNEVPPVGVTTDRVGVVRPQGAFVDQGAYEFTTGTGSAFIWEAVVQNGSSWFDSGNTNNSVRCLVKGSVTTAGAAAIKVFFRGRSDAAYTITKVSIVERDGSTLDGVDGTNTQITFGSTWAAGGTVPQNGELFSDDIAFALDDAKDYFVTYYASGSVGPGILGGSSDGVWRVAGDSAATIDWSGLTLVGTHLGTYGLFYIEEVDDPAPPSDAPILGHSSPYLAVAGVYLPGVIAITDGDNDAVSVAMVGTDLIIRTTPTANVAVTSP